MGPFVWRDTEIWENDIHSGCRAAVCVGVCLSFSLFLFQFQICEGEGEGGEGGERNGTVESQESRGQRGDFFPPSRTLDQYYLSQRSPKFERRDCTPKLRDLRCLTNRINDPPLIWCDVTPFAFYFFHFQSMTDGYAIGDGDERRRG